MKRWTALVRWPGGATEQVDVEAGSHAMATKVIAEKLKTQYQPGGQLYALEQADSFAFGGFATWSVR